MGLKGTLKDFPIADIFQLIGHQQKSGSLYITNNQEIAHVMFDKGMVVLARFKQGNPDLMLGNLLYKSGIVSDEQLQEAIEDQQKTLRSIGDILLGMRYITPETLREFILLQMHEVLFKLFQWKDGLYEFIQEEFKLNPKIMTPHGAEQILLDGFRMLDEWPAIIKKIGPLNTVYKALLDPRSIVMHEQPAFDEVSIDDQIDAAFEEFSQEKEAPKKDKKQKDAFTLEEKKVLPLVDGWKSVKELIDISRMGTFNTCSTLASLLDKNAIARSSVTSESRHDASEIFKPMFLTKKQRTLRLISDLLILAVFILALPSLISYFFSNTASDTQVTDGFYLTLEENPLRKYISGNRLDKIGFALELYRLKNDTYPDTLKELEVAGLITSDILSDDIYFSKTGDSYTLKH